MLREVSLFLFQIPQSNVSCPHTLLFAGYVLGEGHASSPELDAAEKYIVPVEYVEESGSFFAVNKFYRKSKL